MSTMNRNIFAALLLLLLPVVPIPAGSLESDWNNPPRDARLRAYW